MQGFYLGQNGEASALPGALHLAGSTPQSSHLFTQLVGQGSLDGGEVVTGEGVDHREREATVHVQLPCHIETARVQASVLLEDADVGESEPLFTQVGRQEVADGFPECDHPLVCIVVDPLRQKVLGSRHLLDESLPDSSRRPRL